MTLPDAIALIQHDAIAEKKNARWADLGCGSGLFTYALANLLQKDSTIFAIDKTASRLQNLPNPNHAIIHTRQMDFIKETLPFGKLDGILMANSLHYVAGKMHFIAAVAKQLAPAGSFLVVEYDTGTPNPWVPYPMSAHSLKELFSAAGYTSFTKLRERASLYNSNNMYAAVIKK